MPNDHPDDVKMTLGEHLEELRWRIVKALAGLVIACVICIYPARFLLELIARPAILALQLHSQPTDFLATSPVEALLIYIKVVMIAGVVLASPYVLYQLWAFVAAGLYPHERRNVTRLLPWSIGLFLAGVTFMYVFALAVSLNFLVGFNNWLPLPSVTPNAIERITVGASGPTIPASQPSLADSPGVPLLGEDPVNAPVGRPWINLNERRWKIRTPDGILARELDRDTDRGLISTHFKIGDYLAFFLVMTIAFGVAFQLPLVVIFLAGSGIVELSTMRKYRRVVILIILLIAGILAPPDLFSHLLLSAPMLGLFELGMLLASRQAKKQAAAAQ